MNPKQLLEISIAVLILTSCNNSNQSQIQENSATTFKNSLVKRQIPHSSFYISLPKNYKLKEKEGPDFSVYYFAPIDTNAKADFSGGLYLGNSPGEFPPDSTCNTSDLKGKILGKIQNWHVYKCSNHYSLQIVTESNSGEDWNKFIHAFGQAGDENGKNKLLIIFSTLMGKSKP